MLRVAASHQPPLVFVNEAADGSANYTGFLVDLLPMLLEAAGLPRNYSMFHVPAAGGRQLENGSWTGIMGLLTTGKADLALFPMTLTAQRAKHIQHTQPFQDGGYGILVKTQETQTGYSFLLPFTWQTWTMFLIAMLVVILLLTGMDIATRKFRHAAFAKVVTRKVQRLRKRDKLMGHAIETIMMSVNSGKAPTSRSLGVKFLFISWAIFSVIMLAAYSAKLTTSLTVNQLAVQVSTLADLAQSSAYFGEPADSSIAVYFTSSTDKSVMLLRPRMVEYKRTEDGVEDVRRGKIAAFLTDKISALHFTQVRPCNLVLGTEIIGSGGLVLRLHPNSTVRQQLDEALLKLMETGHTPDLRRKWFQDHNECSGQTTREGGRLSMAQARNVFIIPAVGAAAGILIAAAEVFYYNKMFAGVQALRQDLSIHGAQQVLLRRASRLSKSLRCRSGPLDIESRGMVDDTAHTSRSTADKAARQDGSNSSRYSRYSGNSSQAAGNAAVEPRPPLPQQQQQQQQQQPQQEQKSSKS